MAPPKTPPQGPFAEAVRDQHVEEREEYLEDLEEAFRAKATGEGDDAAITVADIHAAIAEVDPKKHQKTIEKYVLRGFGISLGAKGKKGAPQPPGMDTAFNPNPNPNLNPNPNPQAWTPPSPWRSSSLDSPKASPSPP